MLGVLLPLTVQLEDLTTFAMGLRRVSVGHKLPATSSEIDDLSEKFESFIAQHHHRIAQHPKNVLKNVNAIAEQKRGESTEEIGWSLET